MNNNQGRRRTRRVRQQRKQKSTQISRILLTICMMALIAVVSIGGTIAWLTAKTDQITNTFTSSGVEVTLVETDAVENAKEYKMIPGKTYSKDPKATFTYDVDAYLFIQVDESWTLGNYALADYLTYTLNLANNGWTKGTGADGDVPANVWYQEKTGVTTETTLEQQILVGGTEYTTGQVTVNDRVTNVMMKALEADGATNPTLSFQAFAIQKHGFDTAADAWEEVSK